ncbi:LmeA family phospholipid-binding protein [Streptomyces sp. NPDC002851]
MRALRIILIIAVILGGLFVAADRLAVGFAEDKAAEKLRAAEGLDKAPDVSINGFPFLTQVASGELDEVEVGIDDYEVENGSSAEDAVRIAELNARMRGVEFTSDFSSATAAEATGSALISYDELLKAAKIEPVEVAPGVTAKVVGLSNGGNGKIKVAVEATVLGQKLPRPVEVTSSAKVEDGKVVQVNADSLPKLGAVPVAEERMRRITDFQQVIDQLPAGIKLDKVEAAKDGVAITVTGSQVKLVG